MNKKQQEEQIKYCTDAIKAIATAAQEKDENLSFFTVLVSGQGNNKIAGVAGKGDVQDIVKAFVQVLNDRKQMRSMLMSELIASIKKEALELVDEIKARGLYDEEVQHLIEDIDDAGLDVIKMAMGAKKELGPEDLN